MRGRDALVDNLEVRGLASLCTGVDLSLLPLKSLMSYEDIFIKFFTKRLFSLSILKTSFFLFIKFNVLLCFGGKFLDVETGPFLSFKSFGFYIYGLISNYLLYIFHSFAQGILDFLLLV